MNNARWLNKEQRKKEKQSEKDYIKKVLDERYKGSYLMPFGKYKDEHIETVPLNYLSWLINNIPLTSYHKKKIKSNIKKRKAKNRGRKGLRKSYLKRKSND